MEAGAWYFLITIVVLFLIYAIIAYKFIWKIKEKGLTRNEMMISARLINTKYTTMYDNHKYNGSDQKRLIGVTYAWYAYSYKGRNRTVKVCDTEGSHISKYFRAYYVCLNKYNNSFPDELEFLVSKRTGRFKKSSTREKISTLILLAGLVISIVLSLLISAKFYHYIPSITS